jgi:hypothetical protein
MIAFSDTCLSSHCRPPLPLHREREKAAVKGQEWRVSILLALGGEEEEREEED